MLDLKVLQSSRQVYNNIIYLLDDMQRALDALPELKQMSGNVQKHVTLTSEISKLVEDR